MNVERDRVQSGQSTVHRDLYEEGHVEFWRENGRGHGLLDEQVADDAPAD